MGKHSTERKGVARAAAKATKLAAGFAAQGAALPAATTMAGQNYTRAQIAAGVQALVSVCDDVEEARDALASKLAIRDSTLVAGVTFLSNVECFIKNELAHDAVRLAAFGLSPRKVRKQRTAAEKTVSAALAWQTRTVRGTMGPKQRAAITVAGKGGVIVVSPTGQAIGGKAPVPPAKKR